MGFEDELQNIAEQPVVSKVDTFAKPLIDGSEELASHDLEQEQMEATKRDEAKIAEIRVSLGLEQTDDQKVTK